MPAFGIDFGTSTTIVATVAGGQAVVVPDATGQAVTQTCLAFPPSGEVKYGQAAAGRRLLDPPNTLYSFKRILGRAWHAPEVKQFCAQYPFTLVPDASGVPRFQTRAGSLSAEEAAARFLRHIAASRDLAGRGVEALTVTVPASFSDDQRAALGRAVVAAGLPPPALLEEPVAAWLAYVPKEAEEQTLVVYDLGGGTFDLAVLHSAGASCRVLASDGDAYLGADDIDLALADWVAGEILAGHRWDVRTSVESRQRLVLACEQAKIALSRATSHAINLGPIDAALQDKTLTVERAQLEKLCLDLVRRSFIVCDQALRGAGLAVGAVRSVVLSGGGAYMPLVQKGVWGYFKQEPQAYLPPDKVVALGAALHAAGLAGVRV